MQPRGSSDPRGCFYACFFALILSNDCLKIEKMQKISSKFLAVELFRIKSSILRNLELKIELFRRKSSISRKCIIKKIPLCCLRTYAQALPCNARRTGVNSIRGNLKHLIPIPKIIICAISRLANKYIERIYQDKKNSYNHNNSNKQSTEI